MLLIVFGFITATFLRLNNIGMIERRTAVLEADKAGRTEDIAKRLYDLQRYSAAHANATTGPFYLEHQYRRDAQAAYEAASKAESAHGNVNVKAEAVCKPRFTVWSPAYVQCFKEELDKYPASPDPAQTINLPDTKLYRHSFISPLWSFDYAGLAMLICAGIIIVIVSRLIGIAILRMLLSRQYKSV